MPLPLAHIPAFLSGAPIPGLTGADGEVGSGRIAGQGAERSRGTGTERVSEEAARHAALLAEVQAYLVGLGQVRVGLAGFEPATCDLHPVAPRVQRRSASAPAIPSHLTYISPCHQSTVGPGHSSHCHPFLCLPV